MRHCGCGIVRHGTGGGYTLEPTVCQFQLFGVIPQCDFFARAPFAVLVRENGFGLLHPAETHVQSREVRAANLKVHFAFQSLAAVTIFRVEFGRRNREAGVAVHDASVRKSRRDFFGKLYRVRPESRFQTAVFVGKQFAFYQISVRNGGQRTPRRPVEKQNFIRVHGEFYPVAGGKRNSRVHLCRGKIAFAVYVEIQQVFSARSFRQSDAGFHDRVGRRFQKELFAVEVFRSHADIYFSRSFVQTEYAFGFGRRQRQRPFAESELCRNGAVVSVCDRLEQVYLRRADESRREGVGRIFVDVARRAALTHSSVFHHSHPVSQRHCRRRVRRCHYRRRTQSVFNVDYLRHHLRSFRAVESFQRLVQQKYRRFAHRCSAQRDAHKLA